MDVNLDRSATEEEADAIATVLAEHFEDRVNV
jgi:hypothetical protein